MLAIFQEVGVNSELYFIVFGESLLNDGVAVVFYSMMNAFAEIEASGNDVTVSDCLLGCLSFITIAFGGVLIGTIIGFMTGILTKYTTGLSILEPLIVYSMAFLAYFTAELFEWSGILSLCSCGVVIAHYTFRNVHPDSLTTIDTFAKMMSSTMDSIIFLYLGKEILGKEDTWSWNVHVGFVSWAIVFCIIIRFLGIYSFTFILNKYRLKPIALQEQFIMAYGGLRGAVGFALVIGIKESVVPSASMFVSTTLIIVLFTIGFQVLLITGCMFYIFNHINMSKVSILDLPSNVELFNSIRTQLFLYLDPT